MKLCFVSDLHGREPLYGKLSSLLAEQRPDLLILGGDSFVDGEIDDPVGTQVEYVERIFLPRVDAWRRDFGVQVACIAGNHDWLCTEQVLRRCSSEGRLMFLDGEHVSTFQGLSFVGFSLTPPTPYWVKDFERLDMAADETPEIGGMIWNVGRGAPEQVEAERYFRGALTLESELARLPVVNGNWIFVCHAPPHNTNLDRLPHIPHPVGSRAVLRFIEERRPFLSLHGHIHESPLVTGRCVERLGETLSVNPGQSVDQLWAVTFDPSDPRGTLRHTGLPATVTEI